VLEAAAASQWCPDGAVEVLTDDYRLIRYPDGALDPAFPAAQVTWSRSERTAAEVIGEVAGRVRQWGKPGVAWWVSSATLPTGTEAALRAAGGKQIDAVQILARELDDNDLDNDDAGPAGSGDVSVALVAGQRAFRAASMVAVRGWGRKEPTGVALAREYAEAVRDLAAWSSFRVLASVRGEPAAVGGCTLRGEVAHLWGAVTLREYRRRGAYRAVLAERLRLARAHGATLALVKGRAETSGPILLRSGFAVYSEERCYWLPLT
jgi:hypothetical protein